MELKQGTTLQKGKYIIEKTLGQGTFGITYLAKAQFIVTGSLGEMKVEGEVAIKEFFMSDLNRRKADGATVTGSTGSAFVDYRKKFRKEAENLSKLDHQNIVRVYDVFDENGTTYYSMEYVAGDNLDDYIAAHHPLVESEATRIFSDICSALSFMHDRQMLHLDLKPKNIMRSHKGMIYLIDFGLSKQFNDKGEPESSTTIGQGTPGYAPLEQVNYVKDGTFPATLDIYALGATMYKILTGTRPPKASEILNEGFDRNDFSTPKRSKRIIDIIEQSMAPMKKDRFQQVRDIINLLPVSSDAHNDEISNSYQPHSSGHGNNRSPVAGRPDGNRPKVRATLWDSKPQPDDVVIKSLRGQFYISIGHFSVTTNTMQNVVKITRRQSAKIFRLIETFLSRGDYSARTAASRYVLSANWLGNKEATEYYFLPDEKLIRHIGNVSCLQKFDIHDTSQWPEHNPISAINQSGQVVSSQSTSNRAPYLVGIVEDDPDDEDHPEGIMGYIEKLSGGKTWIKDLLITFAILIPVLLYLWLILYKI